MPQAAAGHGAEHFGGPVLIGRGRFTFISPDGQQALDRYDVVALRAWTPVTLTSQLPGGVVLVVDTSPVMKRLGLYREGHRDS